MPEPKNSIPCVGAICLKGDKVLLVRRARPPKAGEWSIPGGRIETGESRRQAVHRELREETGISARLIGHVETLQVSFEGTSYALHDYVLTYLSGEPRAGDDAAEARWVPITEISTFDMWPETVRVIGKAVDMKNSVP